MKNFIRHLPLRKFNPPATKPAARRTSHCQRFTVWRGTPSEMCVEVVAWCLGLVVFFLIYLLA